jgi:hypothetical protein
VPAVEAAWRAVPCTVWPAASSRLMMCLQVQLQKDMCRELQLAVILLGSLGSFVGVHRSKAQRGLGFVVVAQMLGQDRARHCC